MSTLKTTSTATILSSSLSEQNKLEYHAVGQNRVIYFQANFTEGQGFSKYFGANSARKLLIYDGNLPNSIVDDVCESLGLCDIFALPSGESAKSWSTLEAIISVASDLCLDRSSQLVALGGGAVGDVAGLAASLYMRGIAWINIPTTSLAQADSAIGGKTAINTHYGKNMVGTVHPAHLTIMDVELLKTLTVRDLRAGIAEVVKHAILADPELFDWLELVGDNILSDQENLAKALRRSCELKLELIGNDWLDKTGVRQQLNLGHTFAHALEKLVDDQYALNHGEAVAIGLCMAADKSVELNYCSSTFRDRIYNLLMRLGFKTNHELYTIGHEQQFEELLSHDKKNTEGVPNFVYIHEDRSSIAA